MNTLTNLHVKSLQYRYVYTCVHVYVLDLTFSCQTTSHLHVQPNNLSKLLSHCCFDPAWAISQSSKPTKQLGASARCLSKNPPSFCHWCWWTKHGKTISSCDYSDYSNSPISLLKSIILQGAGGVFFFCFLAAIIKWSIALSLSISNTPEKCCGFFVRPSRSQISVLENIKVSWTQQNDLIVFWNIHFESRFANEF